MSLRKRICKQNRFSLFSVYYGPRWVRLMKKEIAKNLVTRHFKNNFLLAPNQYM